VEDSDEKKAASFLRHKRFVISSTTTKEKKRKENSRWGEGNIFSNQGGRDAALKSNALQK